MALKGRQIPLAYSSLSLSPPSQRQRHNRSVSSVTSPPPRKIRRLDASVPHHIALPLSISPDDIIQSPLSPDGGDIEVD